MSDVATAAEAIKAGGVVAHATEGVWGFACDPEVEDAVQRILRLKNRSVEKGLLLIAAAADYFSDELKNLVHRKKVEASWPGPHTWLLPNLKYGAWVTGAHNTVACRVPGHEQARQLCALVDAPLISTSANRAGLAPALTEQTVVELFHSEVDVVLSGEVVIAGRASTIYDLQGNIIRA